MNDLSGYPNLQTTAYLLALNVVKNAPSLEAAVAELEGLTQSMPQSVPEESIPHQRLRKKSYYEQLGNYILSEVERAVSRETLVEDTIRILSEEASSRVANYYLVLEAFIGNDDRLLDMKVVTQSGIHPQRLANFSKHKLASLTESKLVRDVMVNRETIEFLPTAYMRDISYFNEFDDLDDGRQKGAWLCALPLPPADATRPARMLIAVYPVAGSPGAPAAPRGAAQEWRSLIFLRVAYEMLNHQLRGTREQVIAQRRELLADLAPGLVNHEINQQLTILDQSTNLINWAVHQLHKKEIANEKEFDTLVIGLSNTLGAVTRLHKIADAFNNLERRPSKIPVKLSEIIQECAELVQFRLSRIGGKLSIQGDKTLDITTDPALLEHVFINIISNAIEEMDQNHHSNGVRSKIQVTIDSADDLATVDICNNGRPIDLTRPDRIFEKGFTTKARGRGHGLGLHICRMIMTYLGGTISLIDTADLARGMTVGFRIVCPTMREIEDDISENY